MTTITGATNITQLFINTATFPVEGTLVKTYKRGGIHGYKSVKYVLKNMLHSQYPLYKLSRERSTFIGGFVSHRRSRSIERYTQ